MLNYHRILSQPSETKTARFDHFLTLGAHQSTIRIPPIQSLSLITLSPEARLTVNQEKMEENRLTIAIPYSNSIRINEKVYSKYALVYNPKYIHEIQKQQSTFLYVVVKTATDVNIEEQSTNFQEQKQADICNQVRLKKIILNKDQSLEINKRILILLKSGKISVQSTKQVFQANECLYTSEGCGPITSSQEAQILMFQFIEKEGQKK